MSAQLSDHDDADNRDTAEARYRLNRERMARHFREKTRVHLYHQWGEVHNCLTARKLVLRNSAELESMKMGDIAAGTRLIILEERIVDGVVRARVGRDSTPRGLAVISLGWVTAMKDGDTKLDPTLNADGSPSTWQFETFEPSSQGGEESQHAWTDTSPGTKGDLPPKKTQWHPVLNTVFSNDDPPHPCISVDRRTFIKARQGLQP